MAGRRASPYRDVYPQNPYRDEVWNVFNGAPPDFAGGPPGPPVGLPPLNPYGKDRASEPATEDVNPIVDAQAFADMQRQVRAVERRLADVSLQARGVAERRRRPCERPRVGGRREHQQDGQPIEGAAHHIFRSLARRMGACVRGRRRRLSHRWRRAPR